jgi:hypothetical protein
VKLAIDEPKHPILAELLPVLRNAVTPRLGSAGKRGFAHGLEDAREALCLRRGLRYSAGVVGDVSVYSARQDFFRCATF